MKQYGIGIKTDSPTDGTEWRAKKLAHAYTVK